MRSTFARQRCPKTQIFLTFLTQFLEEGALLGRDHRSDPNQEQGIHDYSANLPHPVTEQANKDSLYIPKTVDEMDPATVQIPTCDFMALVRGRPKNDLEPAQLAMIGTFERLKTVTSQAQMHPVFVS